MMFRWYHFYWCYQFHQEYVRPTFWSRPAVSTGSSALAKMNLTCKFPAYSGTVRHFDIQDLFQQIWHTHWCLRNMLYLPRRPDTDTWIRCKYWYKFLHFCTWPMFSLHLNNFEEKAAVCLHFCKIWQMFVYNFEEITAVCLHLKPLV